MRKIIGIGVCLFFSIFPISAERIHDFGNYPACGFQLTLLGGVGAAGNETSKIGYGVLSDIEFRFAIKPFNKLYLLEVRDGSKVCVKNIFGLFSFIKLNTTAFSGEYSGSGSDTDTIVGGGLHLELPIMTKDFDARYASSFLFIEPSLGYDLNDKQIKLEIFPGINAGSGIMGKYLHFQTQIGFDLKFTLLEDSKDLISASYMLVLGFKFTHDFVKYNKVIEDYENEKERQAQIQWEQQQEEGRKEAERRRQIINDYRKNYTVYDTYLFPQIYGMSADVISLKASHQCFVKNVPFGFRKDAYYSIKENAGEILQWIDRDTCLFSFKEREHGYYGYSYSNTYTGLAYIHFDSSVTSYPFDKAGILYVYTGVYNYITAVGATNTIPKFEAVYQVGRIPN